MSDKAKHLIEGMWYGILCAFAMVGIFTAIDFAATTAKTFCN